MLTTAVTFSTDCRVTIVLTQCFKNITLILLSFERLILCLQDCACHSSKIAPTLRSLFNIVGWPWREPSTSSQTFHSSFISDTPYSSNLSSSGLNLRGSHDTKENHTVSVHESLFQSLHHCDNFSKIHEYLHRAGVFTSVCWHVVTGMNWLTVSACTCFCPRPLYFVLSVSLKRGRTAQPFCYYTVPNLPPARAGGSVTDSCGLLGSPTHYPGDTQTNLSRLIANLSWQYERLWKSAGDRPNKRTMLTNCVSDTHPTICSCISHYVWFAILCSVTVCPVPSDTSFLQLWQHFSCTPWSESVYLCLERRDVVSVTSSSGESEG